MRHAVMSGHLAKRFVILTDTAYYIGPFFCWNAMVRLMWPWMLLCGNDRGNATQDLLEGKKTLIELAMGNEKVD